MLERYLPNKNLKNIQDNWFIKFYILDDVKNFNGSMS